MTVAHRLLKNAGSAPAWVMQGKRIRHGLAASRRALLRAYFDMLCHVEESATREADDPDEAPKPDWGKAAAAEAEAAEPREAALAQLTDEAWPAAISAFVEEVSCSLASVADVW